MNEPIAADAARALRVAIATPDRRGPVRERLDGVAEVVHAGTGQRVRGVTVDLGEGGLSLVCSLEPSLGDLLRIEVSGLVVEARVRHVAAESSALFRETFRIGLEAA